MATITQEIRDSPTSTLLSTSLGELVDTQELLEGVKKRENMDSRDIVKEVLWTLLPKLTDRKKDIDVIFDTLKEKAAWKASQTIVGSEIQVAAEGSLLTPSYCQKGSAKQDIYVFIGTHWVDTPTQIYYDFVKEASRKIGLSEVYVQDQDYMNKVFENVAYRLSKYSKTKQPVDGVWINLKNCTVEINGDGTFKTHEHRASDFFKYCLPYNYDPEAMCPLWHRFLDEVLPDEHTQLLLGEYIGYCFTKNLKLEKMAVFYGSGANGKSVILDIITKLFGRSNVNESSLSDVTTSLETRAKLQDKMVNISSESDKTLNMDVLKKIISGEPVDMHIYYKGIFSLYNPPKLITSYNELPPVVNSYALKRRWLLFPFHVTIPENRQDPGLGDKLAQELPGILNWVLDCLGQMMKRVSDTPGEGFTSSDECNEALNTYFNSANSISMFLEECCHIDDSVSNKIKDIFASYQAYCRATGITKQAILKNLKKGLEDWGAKLTVNSHSKATFVNVYADLSNYS